MLRSCSLPETYRGFCRPLAGKTCICLGNSAKAPENGKPHSLGTVTVKWIIYPLPTYMRSNFQPTQLWAKKKEKKRWKRKKKMKKEKNKIERKRFKKKRGKNKNKKGNDLLVWWPATWEKHVKRGVIITQRMPRTVTLTFTLATPINNLSPSGP